MASATACTIWTCPGRSTPPIPCTAACRSASRSGAFGGIGSGYNRTPTSLRPVGSGGERVRHTCWEGGASDRGSRTPENGVVTNSSPSAAQVTIDRDEFEGGAPVGTGERPCHLQY